MSHEPLPFAELLQRFRRTVNVTDIRGLILLGSGQPQTAALLIGALNPERTAFLLTDFARGKFAEIPRLLAEANHITGPLRCDPAAWLCPDGEHADTLSVYVGLKTVLEQWRDLPLDTIAVDLTGGKSTMTVGLTKAAHVLGLCEVYVNAEYAENRPLDGTQFLDAPPDPYAFFGDLKAAEARRLFASHDYVGACRIFDELRRSTITRQSDGYAALARLAEAYAAWDAFDIPSAWNGLRQLLDTDASSAMLLPLKSVLEAQAAALEQLHTDGVQLARQKGPALDLLRDPDRVLPILGSLHMNALRRQDQGRYDVAALLRYRCLELIAQQRLATYGVLSERPCFNQAQQSIPDLEDCYRQVTVAQGRRRFFGLPDRAFGLFVGYMLLAAIDDPLVRGYDIGRIEQRTEARNKSILAHGYRLISEDEYGLFSEVVEDMLNRFFAIINVDRAAWESCYRFVSLEGVV